MSRVLGDVDCFVLINVIRFDSRVLESFGGGGGGGGWAIVAVGRR